MQKQWKFSLKQIRCSLVSRHSDSLRSEKIADFEWHLTSIGEYDIFPEYSYKNTKWIKLQPLIKLTANFEHIGHNVTLSPLVKLTCPCVSSFSDSGC
jgi:hypothetical protein